MEIIFIHIQLRIPKRQRLLFSSSYTALPRFPRAAAPIRFSRVFLLTHWQHNPKAVVISWIVIMNWMTSWRQITSGVCSLASELRRDTDVASPISCNARAATANINVHFVAGLVFTHSSHSPLNGSYPPFIEKLTAPKADQLQLFIVAA